MKCLAQGHKHHGRDEDSNPHSGDSTIRVLEPDALDCPAKAPLRISLVV